MLFAAGDTLQSIAQKYYGKADFYLDIYLGESGPAHKPNQPACWQGTQNSGLQQMTNRKRPAIKRCNNKTTASKGRIATGAKTLISQSRHSTPGEPQNRCQLGAIISSFNLA
jgi:hypothetical protein